MSSPSPHLLPLANIVADEPFSTSAYGAHTIVGTIAVVNSIISAVCQPFLAKLADLSSRPTAFVVSLAFYCVGFILIAASSNVGTVVGGQLLETVGGSGITFSELGPPSRVRVAEGSLR